MSKSFDGFHLDCTGCQQPASIWISSVDWSSLLFLSFPLLFLLLLLGEWIDHEKLTIGWIPLGCQIRLVLIWHQYGPLKRLHDRYVDVGLIFLIATMLRPGQIVPYRLNLLHLRLPGAVQRVLRNQIKVLAQGELGQAGDPLDLLHARINNLTVFVLLFRRWLPAWELLYQVFLGLGGLRPF